MIYSSVRQEKKNRQTSGYLGLQSDAATHSTAIDIGLIKVPTMSPHLQLTNSSDVVNCLMFCCPTY